MRDIFLWMQNVVKVHYFFLMDNFIEESLRMINQMVKEFFEC
jgi:hypothetical protein